MSDKGKSIIAAGWVAAAAGTFILGSTLRNRVDLAAPSHGTSLDTLVASRDNSIGGRSQTEIPAGDFFYELTDKLKKEFYEPINDVQKLASGAVRGMIGYLGDPESTYMDPKEFHAFLNERQGKYEGIGADLEVVMVGSAAKSDVVASKRKAPGQGDTTIISKETRAGNRQVLQPSSAGDAEDARDIALAPAGGVHPSAFPRLAVMSVVPGGPADRAGVKPGDLVYSVDDHWVINPDLSTRFGKAENDFKSHKIDWPALNAIRKEVRDKYERMMLPLRAKDRLILGTSGGVKVVWDRGGEQRSTTIQRGSSSMPGFRVTGDTLVLPFSAGSAEMLRKAVAGKSEVTIDLRNNTLGDFGVMRECLAAVAPSGIYGYETNSRNGKAIPLKVAAGNPHPPKLTLVTDRSTRGAAEIFALALSSRGVAKATGFNTSGNRGIYDIVQLPDGAGYTLVTARYKPQMPVKPSRVATTGGHKK